MSDETHEPEDYCTLCGYVYPEQCVCETKGFKAGIKAAAKEVECNLFWPTAGRYFAKRIRKLI